ncbi:MAG: YraN family protein [Anaeromicrobium sp.]|jgi:putative endonuclease|uniref:YraN family protein n=1 Tax=Anaeromicrobium sp. TaxID=1929132 RepID=UPI0025EF6697|nr:YraN family protein [Anaeromicrobium sp.]MCT4594964.1 YraN family protein [Anaeromicrobium sp.]
MNNVQIGKMGEKIAINYLKDKKYKILDTNYRCKCGEIDIIAMDKNRYVFVEVKTRKNKSYGTPAQAVNYKKLQRIYKVSKHYIQNKKIKTPPMRFDIIEIYYEEDIRVNHIKSIS